MPERVLSYFSDICSIPHGSGNTDMLLEYLRGFAVEHGLRYITDESGNIVIFKNGTEGYETSPSVILQGHTDMVCVKEEDCDIDFLTDGLRLKREGDFLYAEGTSLGGDDGIAVAFALAVLDSTDIPHPPLEVVLTADEETGMFGAEGLDMSVLKSKMLINMDSEDEGTALVSCAGGVRCDGNFTVSEETFEKEGLKITLSGLKGGHSGTEIHKGHLNGIIALCKLLEGEDFCLSDIRGGSADNAIPSFCEATVYAENEDEFIKSLTEKFDTLKAEKEKAEPYMELRIEKTDIKSIISKEDTARAISTIASLPDGVIAYSKNIEGLVETSLNLGVISKKDGNIITGHSLRSSVGEEKEKLKTVLSSHYKKAKAKHSFHSDYPAWEYKENSRLQEVFKKCYKAQTGNDLKISAIHAGLECGLFTKKAPYLDCISFGPDMQAIHSTKEKLSVSSSERTFELLLSVLKELR